MEKLYAQGQDSENLITGSGPVVKQPSAGPGVPPRIIGRYALFNEIAAGGMGVVHLGRLVGSAGFERVVAIKRVHPSMARDSDFVAMFREEIRLLARIRHQNVVTALDVVEDDDELLLVMEYVHGQPLSALARQARDFQQQVPVDICVAVACAVLNGLHAVHTATSSSGEPLGIVHRDVSPQNVLVGCDGVARVLDFGVAKAGNTRSLTRVGQVKGKLGYIAPEHIRGKAVDLRADLYGLSVVLWEMLASTRLFGGKKDTDTVQDVLNGVVPRLSSVSPRRVPGALEEIVRRGLSVDPNDRFASAREMSLALQNVVNVASAQEVGDWVTESAHVTLVERARQLAWAENCPIDRSSAPEIQVGPYEDATYEASELTVRDAHFESDLLDPDSSVATLARGTVRDFADPVTRLLPLAHDEPSDPVTRLVASPAAARRAIAGTSPSPAAVALAAPSTSPDPQGRTQPGRRAARRGDLFVRGALYCAGLIALLTIANGASKGALFAEVRALVPSHTAREASSAEPAAAPGEEASVSRPAEAPRAQPAATSGSPVASTPVPVSSLALEQPPPSKALTHPRVLARPRVAAPKPAAAAKPSPSRPVNLTHTKMVDGF